MTFPGSPAPPASRPNPCQPTAQEDNGEPMPAPPSRDPITALNKIHSDVVNLALTVQQTQHTVQQGHELRDDFDRLFISVRTWAALLVDADNALGVSALARMPTPAARRSPRPLGRSSERSRGPPRSGRAPETACRTHTSGPVAAAGRPWWV